MGSEISSISAYGSDISSAISGIKSGILYHGYKYDDIKIIKYDTYVKCFIKIRDHGWYEIIISYNNRYYSANCQYHRKTI